MSLLSEPDTGAAERVTTAGHLRLNKRNQKGE